jgi:hypothetical protein
VLDPDDELPEILKINNRAPLPERKLGKTKDRNYR